MKRLKIIFLFQKKLLLPGIVVSAVLGLAGDNFIKWTLIAYFFISPLCHYFTYDVRNSKEYYFYNNLGVSNLALWASTIVVGVFCLIISGFL